MNNTLKLEQIVEDLPIGAQQIRIYLKDGRLKGTKIRNKWIVDLDDYRQFKKDFGFTGTL